MSKPTQTLLLFKRGAALCMVFVCAISLLASAGWLFNLPVLASLRAEFISMAPSTALFLLGMCGAWLLHRVTPARRGIHRLVQAGLLLMGFILLLLALHNITGLGADLEQMLLLSPTSFGAVEPAHISPLTVLGFLLVIPALLLLTGRGPGQRARGVSAVLALIVFIFSGFIILSYLYGFPLFYGGTLIPVAATTALAFLFLSLALLLDAGPTCWPIRTYLGPSLRARLMRAFIPVAVVIMLLQGLLSPVLMEWLVNPALGAALTALAATTIFILLITFIAQNLSTDIERANQARLAAENTLNQSEARFRTLVETVKLAIINIDRDGHIVLWNQAAETIFGYSAGEMIGKSLAAIMPEEFRAAHQQGLQHVAGSGESQIIGRTIEVIGLRKDGRQFPLSFSLATWQVDGEVFFTGIGRDITEQRQVELALVNERNLLHTLMDNVPDMIYFKDTESRFIRANQAHARRVGVSDPSQVLGKTDFDIFGEEHAREAYEDEQAIIRSGQPLVAKEEKETFLDGRTGWASTTKMPLRNQQGQIVGTFGISRDITDRKQAEQALRKSESTLQAVFQSTSEGILAVGNENEVLYVSERFAEMWRIPPAVMATRENSTLLGHVLEQLIDPQSFLQKVQELYRSHAESFDTLNFKDGRVFERLSRPLVQGAVVLGRVWSFRDITERNRIEERLEKERILLRTLIDNIPDRIYAMDAQGRKILSNQADWRASGGKTMEDVIGKTDLDMYPLELAKKFWAVNMEVIQSGISILNQEEPGLDPQGNPVWVLSSKVPLRDAQGKIEGLVGIGRDITERKRLEEEIRSLSLTDELTGLYNRRGFTLLAEQEMKLAYRMKRSMLLFFGDVDDLKIINDTRGHAQGDLALQGISVILKENFRESDILARIGGDEFVVLALDVSKESAEMLTKRLQAAIETHNQQQAQAYPLSLSIGVAYYDPDAPCAVSELIAQADGRMYQHKQARKARR